MSQATYYKWTDLPETAYTAQIRRRLVTGEKVMLVNLSLAAGAVVSQHQHPHEQVSYVLAGALEFDINGEKRLVRGGEVVVIPSHVPHAVIVLEDSQVLDVFSPPREDFLTNETPEYMQR
jgi:quercetin dioxygenase-like cupin family protein